MSGSDRPAWFLDWRDDICAIVGSGPSITPERVAALRGRCRVIVINTTYELAPWADALYACDGKWWSWHPEALKFAGLKITHDRNLALHHNLALVTIADATSGDHHQMKFETPAYLGCGSNGGFQATNLAVQFGARKILLLGIDYCGERWHGKHPNGRGYQSERTLNEWVRLFDSQAPRLRAHGVDVVNISEISALRAFPKMSLDRAFERWASSANAA